MRNPSRMLLLPACLMALSTLGACSRQMTEEQIQAEAARIHDEAWIADTHIDAPESHVMDADWKASDRHAYPPAPAEGMGRGRNRPGQWDIPRMKEGGLDAAFMVVYVGQPRDGLNDAGYDRAYQTANDLFDWVNTQVASSPDAELALSVADARRLHAEGKRALFIGMENGYPIGTDLGRIQEFYDKGIRYMTLTHSGDNQIGASSGGRHDTDFGLTEFGRQVVSELNRLGVMVDLSHVSDQTFYDVLEYTDVPVILSHSGCRAIATQAARDVTDDMLRALKEHGGVIQLVVLDSFLKDRPAEARQEMEALAEQYGDRASMTPEQRAELRAKQQEISAKYAASIDDFFIHFEHAVALAGIEHVGFGSDFDGGGGVQGLDQVTEIPKVTEELLRRGYSEKEIKMFWGGNLMRVMEAVEAAAGK